MMHISHYQLIQAELNAMN